MRCPTLLCLTLTIAWAGHAVSDEVFEPQTPAKVHIWTRTDQPDFVYPEQSKNGPWGIPSLIEKPNFGVAVSGGGFRATTAGYGWLRALHELGVLHKARYLSSNSGGSWLNGAFSYTQVPMSQFFQPTIPPEDLTKEAAKALRPGSYGAVIGDASIIADYSTSGVLEALTPNVSRVRGWSDAVSEAFLEPYGVGNQGSSITALGTRGRVHERIAATYPGLTLATATASPDRPFPIILGALFREESERRFFPFEFTPLYAGVPSSHPEVNSSTIGGAFIEPLGLNSVPQESTLLPPSPDGEQVVSVLPKYVIPLPVMVGISSSFIAQGLTPTSTLAALITGTETMTYWVPTNTTPANQYFADGGGIDNLGVTPLLRRKVKSIIACVALSSGPVYPKDRTAEQFADDQYDLSGLFGATPPGTDQAGMANMTPDNWNKNMQVFDTKGWEALYNSTVEKVTAGQPATHRATYTVLDNEHQAVHGGWEVEVLWILLERSADWEAKLPSETRELLQKVRDAPALLAGIYEGDASMKTFPHIKTTDANYDPLLVGLLSNYASYQMYEVRDIIDEMVAHAAS